MEKFFASFRKVKFSVFAIALFLVVGSSLVVAANSVARNPNIVYELIVLHTNDHHGSVLAKDSKGGLAQRATFIKSVRQRNNNVLVLDAGDINTGSALSNMFKAEPDIRAYNLMGYDAVAFGNHEFDNPLIVLENQMSYSKFAWISANIEKADGSYLGKPYIVKDFKGFRVGIIGLTTLRTKIAASPDKSLKFINEISAAKDAIKELRKKENVDIVIIVGHLGDVKESKEHITSVDLAKNISGVDLIIDGHSHSKMDAPLIVNNIPIVSANEWGKFVGGAKVIIRDGKKIDFLWAPVEITTTAFAPDPDISLLLKTFVDQAQASLKEVVMQTSEKFEIGDRLSRYQENALGDLACDATVAYAKSNGIAVDFAFHNGGTVRASLPKGNVTKEDIMTVFPFENYVYIIDLKGSDLIKLFAFIGSIKQGAGAFAQVSKEVRYTITYDENGNGQISDLTINGQTIDLKKTYKIATNDYLAGGGDGYEILKNSVDTTNTSMLISDIVVEYAKTLTHPIAPITDGRIRIVGGVLNK